MGIKKTVIEEYTCDHCHKQCDNFVEHVKLPVDGDGRDVEISVNINIDYEVTWAGPQIICKSCASLFLRQAANELSRRLM